MQPFNLSVAELNLHHNIAVDDVLVSTIQQSPLRPLVEARVIKEPGNTIGPGGPVIHKPLRTSLQYTHMQTLNEILESILCCKLDKTGEFSALKKELIE